MKHILHLRTVNDRNGNPRRLFIVCENGVPERVIDEGYKGLPSELHGYPIVTIQIPPSEYKRWLKINLEEGY